MRLYAIWVLLNKVQCLLLGRVPYHLHDAQGIRQFDIQKIRTISRIPVIKYF